MRDTYEILKQYLGTDYWIRCWIDVLYDDLYGDLSGYCYIKVLNLFGDECDIHMLPVCCNLMEFDFDDSSIDYDWINEIMDYTYTVNIADIDFDVNNFDTDIYTTEDIKEFFAI